MKTLTILGIEIAPWIWAPVVYFLWVSVLLLIKKVVYDQIRRLADKTKTEIDNIFLDAADLPLTLLIFVTGAIILKKIGPFDIDGELTRYFFVGLRVTTVLAIIMFFDRLLTGLIRVYSQKIDVLKTSGNVAQGIVRIVVMGLGLLILLDSFGISITPMRLPFSRPLRIFSPGCSWSSISP